MSNIKFQNIRFNKCKVILIVMCVFNAGVSKANEINIDKLVHDIKSSVKHQTKSGEHNYTVSRENEGKKQYLSCNTNLSLDEMARVALQKPSKVKADCRMNSVPK